MTDSIIDTLHDADLAISVEAGQLRHHPLIEAAGFASEIADQPPAFTLAALATVAGLVAGRPALAEGGARAFLSLWLATTTKAAVKAAVVRTRPKKLLEDGHYETGLHDKDEWIYNSFPSGHTADAFAGARAIVRMAPHTAIPVMAAAAAIGAVQVPRGNHHPADVIAGAAVGIAAEAIVNAAFSIGRSMLRESRPSRRPRARS